MKNVEYIFGKFTKEDIIKALSRKESEIGVIKYKFIMELFQKVNVTKDSSFKEVFIDFYKLNVDVPAIFIDEYFKMLEQSKTLDFEYREVLRHLYKYSKKVHASFASKLLATNNPRLPILDRFVKKHLELKEYYGVKNVDKIIEQYSLIIEIYEKFLNTRESEEWIKLFDEKFPESNIEKIKKIDFILWQIR